MPLFLPFSTGSNISPDSVASASLYSNCYCKISYNQILFPSRLLSSFHSRPPPLLLASSLRFPISPFSTCFPVSSQFHCHFILPCSAISPHYYHPFPMVPSSIPQYTSPQVPPLPVLSSLPLSLQDKPP